LTKIFIMRTRRKWLLLLLGCIAAAVLVLTLFGEHEPQYEGESLSQWAATLRAAINRGGYDDTRQKATEAVRKIGTNGLPYLLKWIQYEDRPWQTNLARLCSQLPGKLGETAKDFIFVGRQRRREDAFSALYALGEAALPSILSFVTNSAEPSRPRELLIIHLGGSWKWFTQTNIIESNLNGCLDDKDPQIAISAAGILCTQTHYRERAFQVLAKALDSPDGPLRQKAVSATVRCFNQNPPTSKLIQLLADTNSPFSPYAASALIGAVAHDPSLRPSAVPLLTRSLRDSRPLVRAYSANALGSLRIEAEPTVTALLEAWNDPDESVRREATNSIFELPRYFYLRPFLHGPIETPQKNADYWERRLSAPPYSTVLTQLLDHSDIRIRQMATNAFQWLGVSNVVNQTSQNASRQP
jgi:HEAT repeats